MRQHTFIFFILYFVLHVHGQPFVSTTIIDSDIEELQGKIVNATQDCYGYIWIGTHNGLHKYDGRKFTKYKIDVEQYSPLTSNKISKIAPNSKGNIWCISDDHIYLFDAYQEEFINIQHHLNTLSKGHNHVCNIFPLDNGSTWLVDVKGNCFKVSDEENGKITDFTNPWSGDSVKVYDIWQDSHRNEWIFSSQGTYLYTQKKLISKTPFQFHKKPSGRVWLANREGDVAYYNHSTDEVKFLSPIAQLDSILDMRFYNDSTLLFASTQGVYLMRCSDNALNQISPTPLNSIFINASGHVWGSYKKHIEHISPAGEVQVFSSPYESPKKNSVKIIEDIQGNVWFFYKDKASQILCVDKGNGTLSIPKGVPTSNGAMSKLFVDNQRNVWFRLKSNLCKISLFDNSFQYRTNESFSRCRNLFIDHKQRLWAADLSGYITIYNPDKTLHGYLAPTGEVVAQKTKFGTTIYCSLLEKNGDIWLGSSNSGIYQLKRKSNQKYDITQYKHTPTDNASLNCNSIYSLCRDSFGQLWIGTREGGLNLFDNGAFVHKENGLGKNKIIRMPERVRCINEIEPGVLMVGSSEGLYVINNNISNYKEIEIYRNKRLPSCCNTLSDNDVMQITKTTSGIYVATSSGGLNLILSDKLLNDSLEFKAYTRKNLLASDIVYSMIEDKQGKIWVIGKKCLTQLDPNTETSNLYTELYLPENTHFIETTPVCDSTYIYLGGTNGYMYFDPLTISKNQFVPPIVFTELQIHNDKSNQRIKDKTIVLESDERDIKIGFAALDYNQAAKIRYRFKLEGVDSNWSTTSNNSVMYLNLPCGTHTLHIGSTNGDGFWVDNIETLTISVAPLFTETIWFWLAQIAAILLILAIILYFYNRMYKLKQSLQFEKKITEMRLHFFTEISHELRTPLTLIDGPATELLENKQLDYESHYYARLIKNNTQRMLTLVNQILDFRKVQNQKMKLAIECIDLKSTLSIILDNFKALAQENNIELTSRFHNDKEASTTAASTAFHLWVDRDKFEKILYNLLSNAFKYTPSGHSIAIVITEKAHETILVIEDEGIGISKENLSKVFEDFETIIKDNIFKPSSGIGLTLVKSYTEMHGGTIEIASTPNEGTRVTLTFKNGKEHLKDKEEVEFINATIALTTKTTEFTLNESVGTNEERPTILIVEDNPELRSYIETILSACYNTIVAANGKEGVELCQKHWPDLVISDIIMPELNGIEMVKQIRSDQDLHTTPIVLLTSKTDIESKIEGTRLRIDDYITKPFSTEYLKTKVNAIIKQRKELKKQALSAFTLKENTTKSDRNADESFTQIDQEFISNVRKYMEENLSDPELSIDQIAQACNYSRTVFYQKVKALMGVKPIELLQEIRFNKATQLLDTQQYNISEVAYMIGYTDARYFSRVFKKQMGVLPSDYMKEKNKENANTNKE